MIWILGALLVMATLDARPDPPATAPHTAKAKGCCLSESSGDKGVQHSSGESPNFAADLPAQWARRADAGEPNRTTGGRVLVRYAADSSPPSPATSQPDFRT